MIKDYHDGSVDRENGVALSQDGVTRFRYPRLAYAAEKVGQFTADLYIGFLHLRPNVAKSVGVSEITPRTARRLGAALLAVALPVAAAGLVDKAPDAAAVVTDAAADSLDWLNPWQYYQPPRP